MSKLCVAVLLLAEALAAQVPAPLVPFSTFLKARSSVQQVATDSQGFIYVFGETWPDYNAYSQEVFVARLDPTGAKLTWVAKLAGPPSTDDFAMTRSGAMVVDTAGNVYVTGYTNIPDFPTLPVAPANNPLKALVPFVAKIDVSGALVYSNLFSNGVQGIPEAIAIDSHGQPIVSGIETRENFPITPGTYTYGVKPGAPFTTKLDATGTKILFSAVGVGGSQLAVDRADNIFIAGSLSTGFGPSDPTAYPTTPGAFQTTFTPFSYCSFLCQLGPTPAPEQYVTKLSADGTKLLYSTYVTGSMGASNAGMTVDAAGDVWLTGDTSSPDYPYTQTQGATQSDLFTTELDPTGSKVLLSVPVGVPPGNGNNLTIDSEGNLIAAGPFPVLADLFANPKNATPAPVPPAETRPAECLTTSTRGIYVLRISSHDGSVLDSRILPGNTVSSAVDSNGNVYVGGSTGLPDTPLTPGVFYDPPVSARTAPGAFLDRVNFSVPASPIGCVTDSVSMRLTGPVAPGQLITIYGTRIGPVEPVVGFVGGEASVPTSPGGVSVTFDGRAAPILYASLTQVNVQVPFEIRQNQSTVMQFSLNGTVIATRVFAVIPENPSVFVNSTVTTETCNTTAEGGRAFALNADGTVNSCTNPAAAGSQFTLFVNGTGTSAGNQTTGSLTGSRPGQVSGPTAVFEGWDSLEVDGVTDQAGAIAGIGQITARVPEPILFPQQLNVTLTLNGLDAGPFAAGTALGRSGTPMPVTVFVKP